MSPEASSSQIRHEPDALRFLVEQDGEVAELVYALERGRMVIEHTRVPEAIGGRGIAGQLVRAAFAHARDTDLRVVPACSYAAAWVARHPEFATTLAD